ncbi:MAG: DUF192 domain-containing protein [Anaerolineales bacterium]|nr:DUF192 domain-containing protein [Anaerolineales bacterium]
MRVFNQTRNALLVGQGREANNFWLRLRGLLGVAGLQPGEGLILVGEKSIHTLFMKFSIDVVYADKHLKVIRTDINMTPYRLGPLVLQSAYVVEMPVGTIVSTATEVGDQLKFEA